MWLETVQSLAGEQEGAAAGVRTFVLSLGKHRCDLMELRSLQRSGNFEGSLQLLQNRNIGFFPWESSLCLSMKCSFGLGVEKKSSNTSPFAELPKGSLAEPAKSSIFLYCIHDIKCQRKILSIIERYL